MYLCMVINAWNPPKLMRIYDSNKTLENIWKLSLYSTWRKKNKDFLEGMSFIRDLIFNHYELPHLSLQHYISTET